MRTSQSAGSLMTAALLLLLIGPLFSFPMLMARGGWELPGTILAAIGRASVVDRLNSVLSTGYAGGVTGPQVWLDLGIGAACFGLAWLAFESFAFASTEPAAASAVVRRRSRLNVLGLSRPRAGLAAIAWKDFNFVCGGRLLLALKIAFAVGTLVFVRWIARESWQPWEGTGIALMIIGLIWLIAETGMHLSRVYSVEVSAQTLDALSALPYETAALAYAKLRALPAALAPALGTLVAGAIASPSSAGRVAESVAREPLGWLFAVVFVLYFWHCCAFMSLVVKRGAFAVAIGMVILAYIAMGVISVLLYAVIGVSGRNGEAFEVIALIGLALASAFMHLRLPRRMRAKASA
jgi:hypothetical protein